jgi:hypothetical protein
MVASKRGWAVTAVAVLLFVFRDTLTTDPSFGTGSTVGPFASALNFLTDFWWVWFVIGGLLLVRDYDLVSGVTVLDGTSSSSGVVARRQTKPISREDIIAATNWKRINFLVFRRSIGVSLATAGAVAAVITLFLGRESLLVTAAAIVIALFGVYIFLTSRSHEEEIQNDYTHRVSVRIPDLFEVHSFHIHLRQAAEDLGYVMTDSASPSRAGTSAQFDENIFLSEGGFVARKRPIAPPISPFSEDSPLADVVNVTAASMILILVGVALVVSAPGAGTAVAAVIMATIGAIGLLYSYITRTRNWAKLYCLVEGTIHTPTASLYGEGLGDLDSLKLDPTVSSPETSTELLVTVGVRSSRYFDDEQLEADFDSFVGDIDTLAQANSARVLETQLGTEGR